MPAYTHRTNIVQAATETGTESLTATSSSSSSSSSVTRSRDGRSMRSPSRTVGRQLQSFCWSETAVVGNLTKPGIGRTPWWSLPSGYFLRAFMDLAGKGQDGLGRNCVRHMCYMTKQSKAAQTDRYCYWCLTSLNIA